MRYPPGPGCKKRNIAPSRYGLQGRNGDLKGSILANLLLIRQLGIAKTGRVELRHSKIRASRTDREESEQTLPIMERMGFVKEEVGRNHLAG